MAAPVPMPAGPVPAWLNGILVRTKFVARGSRVICDNEVKLYNDPTAPGGFRGTYGVPGSPAPAGRIDGISVGNHPDGGVVATFKWSEPGWAGEESLWYWEEPDPKNPEGQWIAAWGTYTQYPVPHNGKDNIGEEWTPDRPTRKP